ncbi:MAG: VanZ family protein [Thermosipho sp. (in: Bacteria)]|nr:VanZ family protein [Thermosipho sp. (in: thermotogales)]
MSKKVNVKVFLIFLILVFWIFLIFYFSSRNPLESSQQSSFVTRVLKKIDQVIDFSNTPLFKKVELFLKRIWFKTENVPAEMLVRKTAHFGLYFILGFISFLGFYAISKIYLAILLGITFPNLVAVLDEYSQQYYNRGSSLNDVIIDLSGIISGVFLGFFLITFSMLLLKILKKNKTNKN